MKKINNKLGFSLIELSVVILVIGILVIGIASGGRIIRQAKISSAKSLTKSSAVASISGLSIWLDSVDESNFLSAEAVDGSNLTAWNDSNPQNAIKNNVTRATSNANIIYDLKGINNLPALSCNGSTGIANKLSGTAISGVNNNFTFFVVSKIIPSGIFQAVFVNGTSSGFGYQVNPTSNRDFVLSVISDNIGSTASSNAEIASGTYNNGNLLLYANGVADPVTPSSGTMITPTGLLSVGDAWKGFIGEIIIFNRTLSSSERRSVEQYLGSKWEIKVS